MVNRSDFYYKRTERGLILTAYNGGETAVIPDEIDGETVIGFGNVFTGNADIKSVVIPGGIKSVPESAFRDCSSLEKVQLGAGVKTVKNCAFASCAKLEHIELPPSV